MSIKIISVAKHLPKYVRKTKDIIPYVKNWVKGQEERFQRKVIKMFEGAGVDKRYSIMDIDDVFFNSSFEEKNNIYMKEITKLAEESLKKSLKKVILKPTDIDYIITVSCTGIMIPSVDAYLINNLKMKHDIIRLPVTEMGCVAGVSGIIYAKNFLKSNPNKRAAVVSVEAPTATFQLEDFSMSNIVSAAIFGDGASCVILSSYDEDIGPKVIDESMYHFYNSIDIMGFKLVNTGLEMILDKKVPETISNHFSKIIYHFLKRNSLKIEDINHLIFHPGGKKIVNTVENLFKSFGKNIDDTKEVLKLYGNMSSATVLYVLEIFMDKNIQKGDKGLMLSFGPGFTAQRILLEW
ncbi:MAG: type III polyketide synthase [Flavobacteriaceae bacterium]|nr:type III polyketide synthase [Flavobacteriaceae bacterium]